MARGGYMGMRKCLAKVAREVGFREEAIQLISDALITGSIAAKGSPQLAEARSRGRLTDRSNEQAPINFGPPEQIPDKFWFSMPQASVKGWNWQEEYLFHSDWQGEHGIYYEVKFKETDVNALLKRFQESRRGTVSGPVRKERLRDASWHDWVAAVATLAHEHSIHPSMGSTALTDLVNARLQRWGLGEKESTTVAPTVRAILQRFGSHPPASPLQKP